MGKILLISADGALVNLVSECLSLAGYQVIQFSQGAGCLELIQAEKPTLVVLDIHLPDYNSLAIIRAIRTESLNDRLPVIVMGSNMREEDALLGLEVGADLCLLEPFHPQVFVARVRSLLRRSEAMRLQFAPGGR